ncbi:SUPT4H1 [Bugula neritina]|uniref:Transcription elongation factor SPT4 n=1 Tax=Bugula neritina TaxID=10212 RepID=A0A7J7JA31_BUGNE|nr:SUPT4H1 [Bugula neritina]
MSLSTIPKDLRRLRACLLCSLVKTVDQFEMDGCDNCEKYLNMKNRIDSVDEYTSQNFDGMTALMSPDDSWVAKWQRINRCVPGVYALSVSGKLSTSMVRELRSKGVTYRSRDTSQKS